MKKNRKNGPKYNKFIKKKLEDLPPPRGKNDSASQKIQQALLSFLCVGVDVYLIGDYSSHRYESPKKS